MARRFGTKYDPAPYLTGLVALAPEYRPDAPPDLSACTEIELDCETTGLDRFNDKPCGLAVGFGGERRYLPFGHQGGGNLDEAVVKRWAQEQLRGKRIANLNIVTDVHWLLNWGVDLREHNTLHDVAHDEALCDDHEKRFNLHHLSLKRLGTGKAQTELPKDAIWQMPASAVAPYAMRDVELVAALRDIYRVQIDRENLGRVQQLEDDVIPAVVEMERNGMPLSMPLLHFWEYASQRLLEKLRHELYQAVGFHVNPDSPQDMTRLWNFCGLDILKHTASGQASFDADIMLAGAAKRDEIKLAYRIAKLVDLRAKFLTPYLKQQRNGVIYAKLNQLMSDEGGTVSGRFSCVKPNMQQVLNKDKHKRAYGWLAEYADFLRGQARDAFERAAPVDFLIKRLFVPVQGGEWLSSDMRQVEYRIFADYTRSPRFVEAYRANPLIDFHEWVAENLLRLIRPDVNRTETKQCNFLEIFGGGVPALTRTLKISPAVAFQLKCDYEAAFPEAPTLARKASSTANDRGFVFTIYGRRCRFLGPRGARERTHKALNAIVQGSAGDYNKLSLRDLYRERRFLEVIMRMTVHDSSENELLNRSKLKAFEEFINQQRVPEFRIPIIWETGIGPSWAEA